MNRQKMKTAICIVIECGMLFAVWTSGSVAILFLNLFYLLVLRWCIAMRGDRYIKYNYPKLYAQYCHRNWSTTPMFIAQYLLLFEKQKHPEDLEALKCEAKFFLLWAGAASILGMILLVVRVV